MTAEIQAQSSFSDSTLLKDNYYPAHCVYHVHDMRHDLKGKCNSPGKVRTFCAACINPVVEVSLFGTYKSIAIYS